MPNDTIGVLPEQFRTFSNLQHEGDPIATSLLFSPTDKLGLFMPNAFIRFKPSLPIRDTDRTTAAAKLTGGTEGALLLDSSGEVVAAIFFETSIVDQAPRLPIRFVAAASASQLAGGLSVVFGEDRQAAILANGERLLSYRGGEWHAVPSLDPKLERIHELEAGVLVAAQRLALEMSDRGFGALLTLGDHEKVVATAGKVAPGDFILEAQSIAQNDIRPIVELTKQDGATIFSNDGRLVQWMSMLYPKASGNVAGHETGKGARHTTALILSAMTSALVISVSSDGPISVYSKGERVGKIFG